MRTTQPGTSFWLKGQIWGRNGRLEQERVAWGYAMSVTPLRAVSGARRLSQFFSESLWSSGRAAHPARAHAPAMRFALARNLASRGLNSSHA